MAAPTRYTPSYDFTGFQSANPNTPLPADKLEIELINIEKSTGETITNLGLIQRADGKLNNEVVELESLSNTLKGLLGTPIVPRGDWAASTAYKALDLVSVGDTTYIAIVDHNSATAFTSDLTANKWQLWANPGFVDGTSFFQQFSGDGSETDFTMSLNMGTDENGLLIFINTAGTTWVPQKPSNYTINGTALTFLTAPPAGTNNIYVYAPAKILAQAAVYAASAETSSQSSAASASASQASAAAAATSAAVAAASASTAGSSAANAASSAAAAAASAALIPLHALNKTANPAVTDDSGDGYSVGSIWVNVSTDAGFLCVDATLGAAIWDSIGGGGGGGLNNVVEDTSPQLGGSLDVNGNSIVSTSNGNISITPNGTGRVIIDGIRYPDVPGSSGQVLQTNGSNEASWATVSGGGGGSPATFAPTNKYSPLKMYEDDGYANGQPDNGTPATHNASAGAVPSFTTAKKRSICVVTVAGTLNGVSVGVGDLLMALQDNPTTAAHWAVIADSTTEFNAAVLAAQGGVVTLSGTYLLKSADPNALINLAGEYTILNQCGYPAIYTVSNNTRAGLLTPRQCASAGLGVGQGLDVDDDNGTKLQQVTFFTLATAAHAADFPIGKKVEVFTDAVHPSEDGSSKGYISNAFIVVSVDLVGGIVYADRIIKYHNEIANATNIHLIPLHEDRNIKIRDGALFMGAPSVIGGEVGWWLTLDGVNPITATISGSGSSRTLTVGGGVPSYLTSQGVRITLDADSTWTGVITGTTGTTITCSVSSSNDRGVSEAAPTSGSVTFVPAFLCSEFDNTTHGGAIVVQQAHGSSIKARFARLWGAGVRLRYSHFCEVDSYASKVVNIGTGISGKSWRLVYMIENYSGSRSTIRHRGCGGRHAYTSSSGSTSVAWAVTHWQFRSGCTCENEVDIKTSGDTGAACDTHAMTNGDKITSEVEFPTSYNLAHSYRGLGGQLRGESHTIKHRQRGGQIGLRIANSSDYARSTGCVDEIDLDVSDLPMRGDGLPSGSSLPLTFASNMSVGFLVQSQAAYTGGVAGERTMFTGDFKFKNAGCGVSMEANTTGRLNTLTHKNVGFAQVYLQDANLYVGDVEGDYSLPNGVETNHTGGAVSLGTGTHNFTVGTGLTIPLGSNVMIQDSTSALTLRTAYGWGRVVSYDSGTGAIAVFIYEKKGSASSVTTWRITIGATQPRYGIVLKGTSTFTASVVKWRVGEGANPTEIFHSLDHTAGKIVNVGVLVIDDPLNKGMPLVLTSGRESDFTINIGTIIYNGKVVSGGAASPKWASRLSFQADAGVGGTWTNMPAAETFLLGSTRAIRKATLTGYSQVRIVGFVETAGVAASKIYPKYRATYDGTVGNWTNLSTGACEFILTNVGIYESSWVTIATAALTDVYICLAGSGGDGAADPVIGNLTLEFR